MRSPVNYAVLGLVIEKPSYGYELMRRLQRRYGELLEVSSPSHVYAALDRLRRERLIVEAEPDGVSAELEVGLRARQPKVRYRATADGAVTFRRWVAARLRDDEQRVALMGRLLAVGARDLDALGDVVDRYDAECVAETQRMPLSDRTAAIAGTESEGNFVRRLMEEERRFVLEAQLRWVEFAREEMRVRMMARDGNAP